MNHRSTFYVRFSEINFKYHSADLTLTEEKFQLAFQGIDSTQNIGGMRLRHTKRNELYI